MSINKSKIAGILKRFNENIDKEYMLNTSDINLNNLLSFYKELVPDWKRKYNKFNKSLMIMREEIVERF